MAKDTFWFKHDSNAGRDLKLMEITTIYTHWGKGIFWDVVEVLREQDGYKFDKSKLKMLSNMIMCNDFTKFKNWYNDCVRIGLFIEDNTYFYSVSLIKRMENWETKKLNGSKGGRPKKTETITESKPNQNRNDNRIKTIREDKIREEKKRVYKNIPLFNEFKKYVLNIEPNINLKSLEYKYNAWVENNWKDGKNKPIKNWKTKISNTLQYLNKNIPNDSNYTSNSLENYEFKRPKFE